MHTFQDYTSPADEKRKRQRKARMFRDARRDEHRTQWERDAELVRFLILLAVVLLVWIGACRLDEVISTFGKP